MAYNNRSSSKELKSPISVFLEYKKWEFVYYDKDSKENIKNNLDNFIILDYWYCIKGEEWDERVNKYTNRYYSNEIKDWWDRLYLIRMRFINWETEKTLINKWIWKTDIKPSLPKWCNLNLSLTILDLNDWIVKWLCLSWNNFFKVSKIIRENSKPESIFSFKTKTEYTDWSKDTNWNEVLVSEDYVDNLKWTQAAKYKKRYTLDMVNSLTCFDKVSEISNLYDELDNYFYEKTKSYQQKYDWVDSYEDAKEVFNDNISIESVPF